MNGVTYLLLGTSCLPRMLVSIHSLRKHYAGPVCIVHGADLASLRAVNYLSDYPELLFVECAVKEDSFDRNAAYRIKPSLFRYSPFTRTVFLDADTLVVNSIDELFPREKELVVTSFSDWTTQSPKMVTRLSYMREPPEVVNTQYRQTLPAINTGVYGFYKRDPILLQIESLARRNPQAPMVDELSMQILFNQAQSFRLVDDRYNLSPLHGCNTMQPHVWHFHGFKHIDYGKETWLPVFHEVWEQNLCGIRFWPAFGDQHLEQYVRECLEGDNAASGLRSAAVGATDSQPQG